MAVRATPVLPVPPQFADAISICMRAKPLQHQDELVALLTWTQTFTPPLTFTTVLEIGTHMGGSLQLWLALAVRVIAIDMPSDWMGLSHADAVSRDQRFQQSFPHLTCILGDSHADATVERCATVLGTDRVDLLFIDGDHSRGGVEMDYRRYSPFVRPGGVIAFHDANDTVHNARNGLGVADFLSMLPDVHLFSVGAEWGGIGAVIMS